MQKIISNLALCDHISEKRDNINLEWAEDNANLVWTIFVAVFPPCLSCSLRTFPSGSATSVIVDRAVAGFLAGVKASYNSSRKGKESAQRLDLGVPGFTLPFNIVGWVLWSVLLRVEAQVR